MIKEIDSKDSFVYKKAALHDVERPWYWIYWKTKSSLNFVFSPSLIGFPFKQANPFLPFFQVNSIGLVTFPAARSLI